MNNLNERHAGNRYPSSAAIKGQQGQFLVIKKGPLRTRVGKMAADGTVMGDSFLIDNSEILDERLVFKNNKRRFMGTHAGRKFPTTAGVFGLNQSEPRKFVVQHGVVETRLIEIGPDGLSTGDSYVIPNSLILDIQESCAQQEVSVDERGAMVIPAAIRDRLRITRPWIVQVEQSSDGFFVRPLRPKP